MIYRVWVKLEAEYDQLYKNDPAIWSVVDDD